MKTDNIRKLIFFSLLLFFAQASYAQQAAPKKALPANVSENKLESKLMGREMPYRVVLPNGYEKNTSSRYAVVYLLHGLGGHYDNWTERTKLSEYSVPYNFIIVTPEGENGWYTDGVTDPKAKYESYIVQELIPEIDKKFRTIADRQNRMIAGLSMGGFGAIKFGVKYPEMFSVAGSFSGAVTAASYRTPDELPPGNIRTALLATFGEPDSATKKSNDLMAMIREASPEKLKSLPFLYIDCGTEDFLFKNNRDFVNLLVEKKVPHEFRQLPGSHNWQFWDSQVKEFLEVADMRLSKKASVN